MNGFTANGFTGNGFSAPTILRTPLMLLIIAFGSTAHSPQALAEEPTLKKPAKDSIAYWVSQLGSDQYLRRETAAQKLSEAGSKVIPDLMVVLGSGDLEVVERATEVISEIAMSRSPSDDGGAWDSLNKLARDSVGRAASRAETAIEEIRKHRATEARTELVAAGIFVGLDEFVIRAISQPRMIVQIDDNWRGDPESLQWLEWLDGIENARVKGSAITAQVMEKVTSIPHLKSLEISDGTIDDLALESMAEMKPINELEIRYVPLTDDQASRIVAMPIRVSLNLMGTKVTKQRVESMKEAAPGLLIEHGLGGFLGVTCQNTSESCEISGVVRDSAAEDAGLIRGDVIVQLNDTEVHAFEELQVAIKKLEAGEPVKVKFRRGDTLNTVDVNLRRLKQ